MASWIQKCCFHDQFVGHVFGSVLLRELKQKATARRLLLHYLHRWQEEEGENKNDQEVGGLRNGEQKRVKMNTAPFYDTFPGAYWLMSHSRERATNPPA